MYICIYSEVICTYNEIMCRNIHKVELYAYAYTVESCVHVHTVVCIYTYSEVICTYSGVVCRYVHTMEFDLSRKKNEIVHFRIMVDGTGG